MAEYLLKPGIECQRTDPVFFHALPDHNAEKNACIKKTARTQNAPWTHWRKILFLHDGQNTVSKQNSAWTNFY